MSSTAAADALGAGDNFEPMDEFDGAADEVDHPLGDQCP